MTLAANDPRHGTESGYKTGCRCDACRSAQTAYMRDRGYGSYRRDACECGQPKDVRAARCRACDNAAREAQHGTESRYKSGCGCDDCMDAAKDARARRRRTPSVKVHNRNGYTNGCRCAVCREGNRVYNVARYARKKAAA